VLVLIRHAKAAAFAATDAERPLTERGLQQAEAQAAWLSHVIPTGSPIIHSPYLRTVQTANIFAEHVKGHCIADDALAAHRSANDVIATIRAYATGDVIVVGHLPTIGEALCDLVGAHGNAFVFKPCSVAILEPLSAGTELYQLRAFVPPALLLP
jgi:phosphohistidine phosphatase